MDTSKRNYLFMFTESVLFVNAMTFLSINVFITYFLNKLGASTFVIGLANSLVSVGAIVSQPYFARKVMNVPYKMKTWVKYLFIQRSFFLLFVLTIPLFAVSHPQIMIISFLISWTIFNIFVGSYGPFYISMFAKTIAAQQRGKMRGFSGAIGNLLALGSAYIASVILRDVPYPFNYTLIFAIGAAILIMGVTSFSMVREEPDQVTRIDMKYFQYFQSIPKLLQENKKFKTFVIGCCFMLISQVSLVYYALYAVREYHINASQVALFTAITGLVNIVGNVLFGIIADKYSNRLNLLISSFFAAAAGFIVIGIHGLPAVYVAYGLTTLCLSGYTLSSGILIIESVPHEKLPMSMSVNTVITLLVSAVVTMGSSFLIDSVSFQSVFLIAGVSGLIGGVILYDSTAKKAAVAAGVNSGR